MRIAGDAFGITAGGKHDLTQVDDGDVLMMRILGEKVQDAFVSTTFNHTIAHEQNYSSGKPLDQFLWFWYPFMKHDPSILRGLVSTHYHAP